MYSFYSISPLFAYDNYERDYTVRLTLDRLEAMQRLGGLESEQKPDGQGEISSKENQAEGAQVIPIEKTEWIKLTGNKKFELGYEFSNIIYKEPSVMREEGSMYGVSGSYTYFGWFSPLPRENNKSMLKIEGKYSSGRVDYKNSGTIDNIRDYMIEVRGLIGSVFYRRKTAVIPYLGFGYRYLNDDSGGKISSTGAYGYERESNYYYMPIGANFITDLNQGWFFETTLEYDIFIKGKQISHLSDVTPAYNDLRNRQKNGYGLRGSLRLRKEFGIVDFVLEPFIRYWNIKKSEDAYITYSGVIIGYGYEPKNNSREYGLKLAARF